MNQQQPRRLDYQALSKKIAHALRHAPWIYELELDNEGWVPSGELLEVLREERAQWRDLDEADLVAMMAQFEKQRYELRDGKIRALYGHSLPGKLTKEEAAPPGVLYHGTQSAVLKAIRATGLKPMRRQYVHLSVDVATAQQVARRRTNQPVILTIHAARAYEQGIRFYRGNDMVWLADAIPSEFIMITNR